MVEIQRGLNERGVAIILRNIGKLYRQFLALLSATSQDVQESLAVAVAQYGGLI